MCPITRLLLKLLFTKSNTYPIILFDKIPFFWELWLIPSLLRVFPQSMLSHLSTVYFYSIIFQENLLFSSFPILTVTYTTPKVLTHVISVFHLFNYIIQKVKNTLYLMYSKVWAWRGKSAIFLPSQNIQFSIETISILWDKKIWIIFKKNGEGQVDNFPISWKRWLCVVLKDGLIFLRRTRVNLKQGVFIWSMS